MLVYQWVPPDIFQDPGDLGIPLGIPPGSPTESDFRMLGVPSRATTKNLSHSAPEMQVAPRFVWGTKIWEKRRCLFDIVYIYSRIILCTIYIYNYGMILDPWVDALWRMCLFQLESLTVCPGSDDLLPLGGCHFSSRWNHQFGMYPELINPGFAHPGWTLGYITVVFFLNQCWEWWDMNCAIETLPKFKYSVLSCFSLTVPLVSCFNLHIYHAVFRSRLHKKGIPRSRRKMRLMWSMWMPRACTLILWSLAR